jgi:hypothetical protein
LFSTAGLELGFVSLVSSIRQRWSVILKRASLNNLRHLLRLKWNQNCTRIILIQFNVHFLFTISISSPTSSDYSTFATHHVKYSHGRHIWNCWHININLLIKSKAIPVTGLGGSQGCQTSRFPHFLDNRLTDGGEVVTLTPRQPFTPRKIPGTHFSCRLSRPYGHSATGRIRSTNKLNDLIGNLTRDLPACSIVPEPTTLPRAPTHLKFKSVYLSSISRNFIFQWFTRYRHQKEN